MKEVANYAPCYYTVYNDSGRRVPISYFYIDLSLLTKEVATYPPPATIKWQWQQITYLRIYIDFKFADKGSW